MARSVGVRITVGVSGFRDLDLALSELPKATARNVLRRALINAATPFAAAAAAAAPDDPKTTGFDLHTSVKAGDKLSRRQQRVRSGQAGTSFVPGVGFRRPKAEFFAEAYVGAGPLPQAHLSEFGSSRQKPRPWLRPSWAAWRDRVLASITRALADEIERARQRLARKAARAAAKQ